MSLNERLRDDYVADCQRGVTRWNQVIKRHGIDFELRLPHRAFHRRIGVFADAKVSPDGRVISEAEWDARHGDWLPTEADQAFIGSLMQSVTEPGKFASWIAPPARGINGQPVDFEVRAGVALTPRPGWEAAMEVPARFNAASFFVDRHLAEGRGDKPAFFYEDTLADLRRRWPSSSTAPAMPSSTSACGRSSACSCLLLDSPEFLATFWGAIKIGAVPIPVNTMMRADDYLYFLEDSRAPVAVVSEPLLAEAGPDRSRRRAI